MLSIGGVQDAVTAMRSGAFWYLQKPVHADELIALLDKASEHVKLRTQSSELLQAVSEPVIFQNTSDGLHPSPGIAFAAG